ncbi:hypothetical protein XELAEV_18044732mg [Xenopus laevis]|uniref:Uncharacterized protein n=1 Tax=Xenopus laevis TaxID=8355 RepID=A0A974H3J1_XENLA|nr:hypothetical protein XELAEV_18044732mg [Xenopus laevis]
MLLTSSVPPLHSEVREAFVARWLLTCSKEKASQCEYLTVATVKIRVMFQAAGISMGNDFMMGRKKNL